MYKAQRLSVPPLILGEGPLWHAERHVLFFVDIEGRRLRGYREGDGLVYEWETADRVGFVVPYGAHLLAGVGTTLCTVDVDTGRITPVFELPHRDGTRVNDAKCDPAGRLLVGLMAVDRSRRDVADCGALLTVDARGVMQENAPMNIPNGMAWTGEDTFYHTDTTTHGIDRYDRLPDGSISNRRRVIAVGEGAPDGFCIDDEGMLWVALWGAGCVQRYDPHTGRALAERIDLPERNVSCCCFGGADLRTLYITTASAEGESGGLYACRVPVGGPAPFGWQGALPRSAT